MKNRIVSAATVAALASLLVAACAHTDDSDYGRSELKRTYEKHSAFTSKVLPFMTAKDNEAVARMSLEEAKTYDRRSAPLRIASLQLQAAVYLGANPGTRRASDRLYLDTVDLLLSTKSSTKTDEDWRTTMITSAASSAMGSPAKTTEDSRRHVAAMQVGCQNPNPYLCDLSKNAVYRKTLMELGDANAVALQNKVEEDDKQQTGQLKALAAQLAAAHERNDPAAIVRLGSQLLVDGKEEFKFAYFLRAIVETDRSRAFEKLNNAAGRDAALASAKQSVHEKPTLDVQSLDHELWVARKYGLDDYARVLSEESKATKAMGDIPMLEAFEALMASDQEGLRRLRELRDKRRDTAMRLQDQGAELSAEWAREKYRTLDQQYRDGSRNLAEEQQRLGREAEEDRRRSAETWRSLASALGAAADTLARQQQQSQTTAYPRAAPAARPNLPPAPSAPSTSPAPDSTSQPAMDCVQLTRENMDRWAQIKNTCPYPITVSWCYESPGDCKNGKWGHRNVSYFPPGRSSPASTFTGHKGASLSYAACSGRGSPRETGPNEFYCR